MLVACWGGKTGTDPLRQTVTIPAGWTDTVGGTAPSPYQPSQSTISAVNNNWATFQYQEQGTATGASEAVTVANSATAQSFLLALNPPIIESSTAPAAVTATTTSVTTASFTPVANSLIVAIGICGNNTGSGTLTAPVTDSLGSTWTLLKRANGGAAGSVDIWAMDAGSSPAARTCTVTGTGGANAVGVALCVKVLVGPKPAATVVGASGSAAGTTAYSLALTSTITGSLVVGGLVDVVAAGALTANANTTAWQSVSDATNTEKYGAWRGQALVVTPGAVTYGYTNATGDNQNLAAVELLAGTAGAGGANFTQTVIDPVGIVDAAGQVGTFAQIATDPEGLLDAAAQAASYQQTITDSVGLLDGAVYDKSITATLTDPIGLVDAASQTAAFTQTETDPEGLLDAAGQASSFTQTATDPVGLLDAATQATSYAQTVTDPQGIVDSTTQQFSGAGGQTFTDPVGLTDAASQQASFAQTLTDPVGLQDSAPRQLDRPITDPIGGLDAAAQSATVVQSVTDPVGLLDAEAEQLDRPLTDSVGLLDSQARLQAAASTITDPVGSLDSTSQVTAAAQALTDPVGIVDSRTQDATGPSAQTHTNLIGITDAIAWAVVNVAPHWVEAAAGGAGLLEGSGSMSGLLEGTSGGTGVIEASAGI
jgi:hypothetical protein